MSWIVKNKWLVIVTWVVAIVGLLLTMPNFNELVREKGQLDDLDGYPSALAKELLNDMQGSGQGGDTTSIVVVLHEPNQFSSAQYKEIEQALQTLKKQQEELGLTQIVSHVFEEPLENQLVSDDGKTIIFLVDAQLEGRKIEDIRSELHAALSDLSAEVYLTGSRIIEEDNIISAEDGLRKTEWITIVFILIVLLLVFRSLIAPFVPLLAVSMSYLAAQAVVAFMVDWWDFPLSNFTQIFMVAVMFGIGTDYCILLLSRYKEELARQESIQEAIIETYRTGGKTVIYSGLTVLVGFTAIGLSTFKLYQSAVAVAVGVAFLLLALFTIVPWFMAILGKKLFWPVKQSLNHRESKLWDVFGRFAWARPLISLMIVAVIAGGFLLFYEGDLSYNALEEISEAYESVKGFNLVSDSFGPGESLPSQLVIKHDQRLDTPEAFAIFEQISRELERKEGIALVRGVTRPVGDELKELYVAYQADHLQEGIGEANDGIDQIRDGLQEASQALVDSSPELEEAVLGVEELISGTEQLRTGVLAMQDGLNELEKGMRDGATGATELKSGLEQLESNAKLLANSAQELQTGFNEIDNGLGMLTTHYQEIADQLANLNTAFVGVQTGLSALAERYPELSQDTDYLTLVGTVDQLKEGLTELHSGLTNLNSQLSSLAAGLSQTTAGFSQMADGNAGIAAGLSQVEDSFGQLETGIHQAADGQREMLSHFGQLIDVLSMIRDGQQELASGFRMLDEQLLELTDGLDQSVDGLTEIHSGLESARDFLTDLSGTPTASSAGIYIPEELFQDEEYVQVLDMYMSDDRTIVSFDIILEQNPYSKESLDLVGEIERTVQGALQGTDLTNATVAVGGVSATFADLSAMSSSDFFQTVLLMMIGILIVLILLFRSLTMPIYIIASLVITYYTSYGITELLFVRVFDYTGLTWNIPFFSFVILISLGVDYSIFLMGRFNEYRHLPLKEAMLTAMRNMGTVIFSAAIILSGTFAAMLPSGMLSLIQIATLVITGLFLYSFVFLPLFVPVMVKMFGQANWWPFGSKETDSENLSSTLNQS